MKVESGRSTRMDKNNRKSCILIKSAIRIASSLKIIPCLEQLLNRRITISRSGNPAAHFSEKTAKTARNLHPRNEPFVISATVPFADGVYFASGRRPVAKSGQNRASSPKSRSKGGRGLASRRLRPCPINISDPVGVCRFHGRQNPKRPGSRSSWRRSHFVY